MKQTDPKKLTLFALTWPIFIEMFLHILMGNADTIMLSQYSDNSVAAVGMSNQVLNTVILVFSFIVTGTSVLIAQSIGANDRRQAEEIASVSITVNFLLSFIVSGSLLLFGESFLKMLNTPESLMDEALIYLQIIGGFSFVQAIIMTLSTVIRSHGFTRDAMYVTIGMNILNIIGNYLFIFGPFGMPVLGVEGVAISTVVSRSIGMIVMFILLYKKVKHPLGIKTYLKIPKIHIKNLLKIGIPSAGENLSYNLSQLVITFFITLIGSEDTISARYYTMNLMFFTMIFSGAIGQGTQILVAYKVGSGDNQGAYKMGIRGLKIGMAFALVISLLLYLSGDILMGFFTDNQNIIDISTYLLLLAIMLEPGRTFNIVLISSLRAASDVKFPVYMALIFMWGVCVPAAYFFGITLEMGLAGIWLAYIADEWLRGLFMLWRWKSRIWERMIFIRKPNSPSAEA
ncbi:MATE family efflux transporter [Marinicrinis lubricantis]|uniref:MATE family efflux transporter n=1 Tax=Marinicrinis lubricantis TaxID=2086470 RepID=A0ABW1IJH5_9BACL